MANSERIRTDNYELTRRTAREMYKMTRTMEMMQERMNKWEGSEKNRKPRANTDNLTGNHLPGGDQGRQDRQHRGGRDGDKSRRRTG